MSELPRILTVSADSGWPDRLAPLVDDLAMVGKAQSAQAAQSALDEEWVRIVVLDGQLCGLAALEREIAERWPDIVVLRALPHGEAVAQARDHASLGLPLRRGPARASFKDALKAYDARRSASVAKAQKLATALVKPAASTMEDDGIIRAADSPMADVCEKLKQIAHYDIPVLLMGESGTGKELAARALHARSLRWNKPIVVENCAALPDELLESELFGHVRGAFTGAVADREGMFARAHGGTIFLDEIGEISPAFQVKLLRVLQEGEVRKLGGQETQKVDVRVVAATNRNLEADVQAGRFREDLYYRLTTVTLALPALRARPMDVDVLAHAFLARCQDDFGKVLDGFAPATLRALNSYDWPGNVRELHNEIKHMVVMAPPGEPIPTHALSPRLVATLPASLSSLEEPRVDAALTALCDVDGSLKDRIEAVEARILTETLDRHAWNKSRAARELGLSRVGLRSKLDRYGIQQQGIMPELVGTA